MTGAPVLVVTSLADLTADLVVQRLYDQGVPVVRLDPADFMGADAVMSARYGDNRLSGFIRTPTRELELNSVRATWWRRPTVYTAPPEWPSDVGRFAVNEAGFGFTGVIATLPGLWVNHPWHNRAAEHKPLQLTTASACGFAVPPTLITNSLSEAREFVTQHSPAVYKPLRSTPLKTSDGSPGTIWVAPVAADELDETVSGTAHMFQAQVDKVADIRVTVVGKRVFAVRIDSDLLDWRADYTSHIYTLITCPPAVEQRIHRYMECFKLLFGAFDFALTVEGEWVFLECNPNGQWAWIAEQEGMVADALADLLKRGRS